MPSLLLFLLAFSNYHLFIVKMLYPSPLLSICPASCVLRCTQCHCSDNYLLKCLCLRPSVCGCHLCLVRCARLPVSLCPARGGKKASHGVTSLRFPHKHGPTKPDAHTLLTGPTFPMHCPRGYLGLAGKRASQQWPPKSLLSCPVNFVLFCQHWIWKKVEAAEVFPLKSYLGDTVRVHKYGTQGNNCILPWILCGSNYRNNLLHLADGFSRCVVNL